MIQKISHAREGFSLELDVLLIQEGNTYVAYCPSLELSTYADSKEEVSLAFNEALEIFLDDTNRKGTLEKVLLNLGWRLQKKPKFSYEPPSINPSKLQKSVGRNNWQIMKQKLRVPA